MNLECDDPVQLDTKGLNCPMPLLKAKQMLNKLVAGQVLLVESTDAGSVRDFQVFATQSGHVLLNQTDELGVYKHWLKKRDPVARDRLIKNRRAANFHLKIRCYYSQ